VKHSEAAILGFSIQSGVNGAFSIGIEDNGRGFEPNREHNGHYGLENMRHRAVEQGADFSIVSENGKGTKISVTRRREKK